MLELDAVISLAAPPPRGKEPMPQEQDVRRADQGQGQANGGNGEHAQTRPPRLLQHPGGDQKGGRADDRDGRLQGRGEGQRHEELGGRQPPLAGQPANPAPESLRESCLVQRGAQHEDGIDRAQRLVPGRRLAVVLTAGVDEQLADAARQRGARPLVQPLDRGPGTALGAALASIAHQDPQATVIVLPAGGRMGHRLRLAHYLAKAAWGVRCRPDLVVMLGVRATGPDPDERWIEPGAPIDGLEELAIRSIERFVTDPTPEVARALYERNALAGTEMMVGTVERLLDLSRAVYPTVVDALTLEDASLADQDAAYERLAWHELTDLIPSHDDGLAVLALPDALLSARAAGHVWTGVAARAVAA